MAYYYLYMRTIEVQTPQNVVIEYEIASLRERMLAFFIDLLVILLIYLVLLFAFLATSFGNAVLDFGFGAGMVFFFFPLLMFMGYHYLSEMYNQGQSWGKRAMGIRVVRLDGKVPSAQDCLLRTFFHLVETLACVGILSAFLISSTAHQQRLGDMSAHTVLVRLRNVLSFSLQDILSINSQENYSPVYPQAAQLSERDMLTVKNALARYQEHSNRAHLLALEALGDRLADLLGIKDRPSDPIIFLKQLLRDFVVLTR